MTTIYLAGGLFNAGERLHNLYLEKHLKHYDYTVILPQREAKRFFKRGRFDIEGIVSDCAKKAGDPNSAFVGCLDGADADSGTAVEYGIAISTKGHAVVYRTDFRTDSAHEVGVNAMFGCRGTKYVYHPAFFCELDEVDAYYQELALKIHKVIRGVGV